MKKLALLSLGIVAFMAAISHAGQPMTNMGRQEQYQYQFAMARISSSPVVSPSTAAQLVTDLSNPGALGLKIPSSLGQRTVKITFLPTTLQGGTSVFYNMSTSTQNIFVNGYMTVLSTAISGNTAGLSQAYGNTGNFPNEITIESNSQINVMVSSGVTPVTARVMINRMNP